MVLVTLCAAFVTFINVRGLAWKAYQEEALARGERLDVASLVPPPVPDEENFAATPLLAPLLEYRVQRGGGAWRDSNAVTRLAQLKVAGGGADPGAGSWRAGQRVDLSAWQAHYLKLTDFPKSPLPQSPGADVLRALSKFEPEVAELHTASQRPYSRFALHYEEGMFMLSPHIPALLNLQRVVQLRALAELAEGQTDAALADTQLALRLAEGIRDEPLLVSQLARAELLENALQPLWEGLARHQWTDRHLQLLERELAKINLLAGLEKVVRFERNNLIQMFDLQSLSAGKAQGGGSQLGFALLQRVLSGFFNVNKVMIARTTDEYLLPTVNAREHRIDARCIRRASMIPRSQRGLTIYFGRRAAASLMPAVARGAVAVSARQAAVDQARIACALERYRLRHQKLPDSLEVLQPGYIERLPKDLITGQPVRYQRREGGGFTLYSVGINEQDDGGVPAWRTDAAKGPDFDHGDWVWSQP